MMIVVAVFTVVGHETIFLFLGLHFYDVFVFGLAFCGCRIGFGLFLWGFFVAGVGAVVVGGFEWVGL